MSHLQRTRFKEEIVAEFLIPEGGSDRVIILAPGMPTIPSQGKLIRFLVKRGFSVFFPRYRGSWESGGDFLTTSPHQDVLDVIAELPKGFTSAWDGAEYKINPKQVIVICSSFGGPAGLLAAQDSRIDKVIAFSPVVDWTEESREEPFDFLKKFVQIGFGEAYRGPKENWKKLESGGFYDPASKISSIPSEKIWIFHAKDDEVVLEGPVQAFAEKLGCKYTALKKGGHFGMNTLLMKPFFFWKIRRFLSKEKTDSS